AVPVAFSLRNDTDAEISYSLEITPTENTTISFDAGLSGNLQAGNSQNLDGTYSVDYGAVHVEREMNPDEKVLTQAEWLLTIEGKTIALHSGLIPREPITLSSGPAYPSVSPCEKKTIGVGIRNNMDKQVEGEVRIKYPTEFEDTSRTIPFKLDSSEESELDVKITGSATASTVVLDISVLLSLAGEMALVNERSLSVGVLGSAGAYAHRSLDNHYVVENESLRLLIKDTPPHVVRTIENKTLGEYYQGWALLPSLGYPFPSGGNEWERKRFDVRLVNEADFAAIELEAESIERPGVLFTITYKVYPGRGYIEIATCLKNAGSTVYENLGVRVGGWMSYMASSLYVPVRGDVYRLTSAEWTGGGRQLSKKPETFHESWCASKSYSGRLMGYIWDSDDLVEVHPRRQYGIPTVEYKLPDLNPGDSTTKTILHMVVNQSEWSKVRALWSRLSGSPIDSVDPPSLRSDLEAEIVPVSFDGIRKGLSPVLVDRSRTNKYELRIRVIHDTTISGSVIARMPEGVLVDGKSQLTVDIEEISIDKPFTLPIDISAGEDEGWLRRHGELEIRFPSRIEIRPFAAILFDSSHQIERSVETFDKMKLHTLESGGVRIAASPEYVGSLVRFGYSDEDSMFRDTGCLRGTMGRIRIRVEA
ncbi:MAG: COG1470 family protein, partial [Candidatus Thorarchaeota archaeon]